MIIKRKIRRACGHRYKYLMFDYEMGSAVKRLRSTVCDDCDRKGFNPVSLSNVPHGVREPVPTSGEYYPPKWKAMREWFTFEGVVQEYGDDQNEPEQLPELDQDNLDLQDWLEDD